MTFTHALATNNYGPAKFIVSANVYEGTHTTIATALTSASSGDTIFIRPGTYTENLTLKAGVNLTAYGCDASLDATGHVIISGKATFTGSGTVTISGIQLQTNSDFFLAVTGNSASVVSLVNCYLNASNNTGISFTSSSGSSQINVNHSKGNLGTTGIKFFDSTASGSLFFFYSSITNTGASTTASTITAGGVAVNYSSFQSPITTSSTATFTSHSSIFDCGALSTIAVTYGGSGTNIAQFCVFSSGGTSSAISIGATLLSNNNFINSSNATAIAGAGTIQHTCLTFANSNTTIGATTITPLTFNYGYSRSTKQPGFLAYLNTQDTDVTGNGATYTLGGGNALTEVFDQNSDFNTNGTFTAPITGRYYLQYSQAFGGITAGMTSIVHKIVTSNQTITIGNYSAGAWMNSANIVHYNGSVYCDMDAADTATYTSVIGNGAGNTADSLAPATGIKTYVSGFMLC